MASSDYKEIHAYMLKKTREYCQRPPRELIEEISRKKGVSYEEAEGLVTPILVQRYIKEEMKKLWPEFMASIPSNPLEEE